MYYFDLPFSSPLPFFFFWFVETRFCCSFESVLVLALVHQAGLKLTKVAFLCLPGARIKDVRHHQPAFFLLLIHVIFAILVEGMEESVFQLIKMKEVFSSLKNHCDCRAAVAHAFNPSTWEA